MRGIIAVLLVLVLAGCAAPPEAAPDLRQSPAPAVQAEPPRAENMRASLVESSARPLLEEEILAAYERAQRVYGWFDLAPLPTSGETAVLDQEVYHRVDMDGIEEVEDLRTFLRSVFSQELTDRLLDGETARIQYRDINGALYAAGVRRDRDAGKGRAYVETEQLGETVYSVNVLVDLLGEDGETVVGLESWSFPYAFEDDRWVFTDFCLVD